MTAMAMGEANFFRPRQRQEGRGGERFLGILKRVFKITVRVLFLFLLLFVGHRLYVHLVGNPSFQVREVEVEGQRRVTRDVILSLAKIEGMPNLFTLRLRGIAKRLEHHPWIDHVTVRKAFPNKIVIHVVERKPIAILQLEELYYIDTKGVIFSPVGDRDEYNYPFLTGLNRLILEKNPEEAKGLILKALEFLMAAEQEKNSPLKEISEIHIEKHFGIQCFTQPEGLEVRVGWDQFGEKLRRLSLIWSDLQKRGCSVSLIDCTDLKRMVVRRVP